MFMEALPGEDFYEESHRRSYDDELLSIANPYRSCVPSETSIPTVLLQPHHKRARGSLGKAPTTPSSRKAPSQTSQTQPRPPRSVGPSPSAALVDHLPEPLKPSEMMAILIVGEEKIKYCRSSWDNFFKSLLLHFIKVVPDLERAP